MFHQSILTRLARTVVSLVSVTAVLAIFVTPSQAEASEVSTTLPSFGRFVGTLSNGQAGVVRGVYVPGLLALRVAQQPVGNSGYVFAVTGIATQFQMATEAGAIGLLAHNFQSGRRFFELAPGQEVLVVYGNGEVQSYLVSDIYRYQALEPTNPRSDFMNLDNGEWISASDLFYRQYVSGRVTFQTCIRQGNDWSWGRLFVVATPQN